MVLHNRDVRTDVRELGALVGDVLSAQTSTEAYETVEDLRHAAIDYRRGDAASRDILRESVEELSTTREEIVARAFTTYFELINLAEERERVRAIRNADENGSLHDSFDATIAEFAEADVGPDELRELLADVLIEPTFTAHPTEARRATVKAKLRSIANHRSARRAQPHRARAERDLARHHRRGDQPLEHPTGAPAEPGARRRGTKRSVVPRKHSLRCRGRRLRGVRGDHLEGVRRRGLPQALRVPLVGGLRPRRQPVRHAGGHRRDAGAPARGRRREVPRPLQAARPC